QDAAKTNVTLSSHVTATSSTAILATALVPVREHESGRVTVLRALIDHGSQATFMSERAAQMLRLKRTPVNGTITGVGSTKTNVKHTAEIQLLSRHDANPYDKPEPTPEERKCEEFYETTTIRNKDGRYIVRLPKKTNTLLSTQGDTRTIALKRFYQLEQRFKNNSKLKSDYATVIKDYELNYMEENSITTRFENCDTLQELLKAIVYCKRFLKGRKMENKDLPVNTEELDDAMKTCLRMTQKDSFEEEIENLKTKRPIKKQSKLNNLKPYLDDDGILRVGGRLRHADLNEDVTEQQFAGHVRDGGDGRVLAARRELGALEVEQTEPRVASDVYKYSYRAAVRWA
ncbi:hypothetical protein HW555_012813, partial [Spodoptera exigua]